MFAGLAILRVAVFDEFEWCVCRRPDRRFADGGGVGDN